MQPAFGPYRNDDDYWRMREFLRELFILNGRVERNWHVARLDYARWHTCLNCAHVGFEDVVTLWELDGRLVAFLMPDGGPGEAHLAVHPDFRTPELEAEMLDVAEQHLTAAKPDGSRRLCVWVHGRDDQLRELVRARDYAQQGWSEHQRRRDLDASTVIEDVPVPAGYDIHSMGDGLELLERCYASGLGFHEGDLKVATENRDDVTWYRNIQRAPLYRRDLDLVATAPGGAVACLCTIWFDDVTRSACYEPVATVPAHRRRGLARAVLTEGLRRLQRLGCTRAFVGGYSPEANALYTSVMGPEHELSESWVRRWAS